MSYSAQHGAPPLQGWNHPTYKSLQSHFGASRKFALFLFSWSSYHTKYLRFPRSSRGDSRLPGVSWFHCTSESALGCPMRKNYCHCYCLKSFPLWEYFLLTKHYLEKLRQFAMKQTLQPPRHRAAGIKRPFKRISSLTCTMSVMFTTCSSARSVKANCGWKSSAKFHPLLLIQRLSPTRIWNSTLWHHRPSCSTSGQPDEFNQFLPCS